MSILTAALSDPRNFQARRLLHQLEETTRTRAAFYLGCLLARSQEQVISQSDLDQAIGRATTDKLNDRNVHFDRERVAAAVEGLDDMRRIRSLREVVDALPS